MKQFSYDFDGFRRWFNSQFSLSFDGKFKGLSTIYNLSTRLYELFRHRLQALFRRHMTGHVRPLDDVITLRVSGHTFKLYSR